VLLNKEAKQTFSITHSTTVQKIILNKTGKEVITGFDWKVLFLSWLGRLEVS